MAMVGLRQAAAEPTGSEEVFDAAAFPYPVVTVYGAVVMETVERLRGEGGGGRSSSATTSPQSGW